MVIQTVFRTLGSSLDIETPIRKEDEIWIRVGEEGGYFSSSFVFKRVLEVEMIRAFYEANDVDIMLLETCSDPSTRTR
jgi:hypothetical protein